MLDAGINFIDTSIDYGRSEELIGKLHLAPPRRVLPRLEVRLRPGRADRASTSTPRRTSATGVENSLRLLKTDHLDLVQFHRSLTQDEFEAEGALERSC